MLNNMEGIQKIQLEININKHKKHIFTCPQFHIEELTYVSERKEEELTI